MRRNLLAADLNRDSLSEPATPRPTWQMNPCPPWCDQGHREQDYYADRHHFATVESIDLSLYDDVGSNNASQPGRLDISVSQHYRYAEPDIELVLPKCKPGDRRVEGETSLMLTVSETQSLRDQLSMMLVLVDAKNSATS